MYDLIGDIIIVKDDKNLNTANFRLCVLKTKYNGLYRIPSFKIIKRNNFFNLNLEITQLCKKYKVEQTEFTTIYKQNKSRFLVDLNLTYISNRYSNERIQISKYFKRTDIVLVLFDGIGLFSLSIAKYTKFVYGLDCNPYCEKISYINAKINKVKNYLKFNQNVNDFDFNINFTKVLTINPYLFFDNFLLICKKIHCSLIIDYILIYDNSKNFIKSVLQNFYGGSIIDCEKVRTYSSTSSIYRFVTFRPIGLLKIL